MKENDINIYKNACDYNKYGYCATCNNIHLDDIGTIKGTSKKGAFCEKYREYEPLNYDGCGTGFFGSYSCNSKISNYDIKSALDKINYKSQSYCWITTVVVNILGYVDNCYYLTQLRRLRDEYLQKDLNKLFILIKYDMIGPQIAKCIQSEKDCYKLCIYLENTYIKPLASLIENNNMSYATELYMQMTNYLQERYSILFSYKFNFEDIKDTNIKQLGHGRNLINNK